MQMLCLPDYIVRIDKDVMNHQPTYMVEPGQWPAGSKVTVNTICCERGGGGGGGGGEVRRRRSEEEEEEEEEEEKEGTVHEAN